MGKKGGDINTKVELTGEKEFKQGISNLTSAVKVNRSELKLLDAQYGKNNQSVEALKAKHDALGKTVAFQTDKVKALYYQMVKTTQKYGEADQQTMEAVKRYNDARTELENLNAALRKVESSLAQNSGSVSVYAKRHRALKEDLVQQNKKLLELKKNLEKARQEYGEDSAEVKRLSTAYTEAEATIKKFTAEIKANNEAAKNAQLEIYQKKLDSFNKKMQSIGGGMQTVGDSMTKFVTAPVTAGFALITKGTEEFRGDLAKLENNANLAGASMRVMHEQMGFLNAVTGETDSNIEALSNLLQTGFKDGNLAQAVELLSGAVLEFPDTLKIESLADSLQETVATKEATGQFAEMLGRLGIQVDDFSEGLKRAAKTGQETQYVLDVLGKTDLSKVTKSFAKNNAAMIESQKAAYEFQVELAKLGDRLAPVLTKITKGITSVLDAFNGLDDGTQNFILTIAAVAAAVGPLLGVTGKLVMGIGALSLAMGKNSMTAVANSAAIAATGTSAATAAGGVGALNASLSASPALLVVAGLLGVGAAIAAIVMSAQEANPEIAALNKELKEQKKVMDDLKEEREEAIKGSIGEADHLQSLMDELKSYVDENGKVLESKERVKFITDEINKVMPNAVKWVDSETIAYEKGAKAIDAMIAKKRAKIVLDAMEPEYENAVLNIKKTQNEQAALGLQIEKKRQELDQIAEAQRGKAGEQHKKRAEELRAQLAELEKQKNSIYAQPGDPVKQAAAYTAVTEEIKKRNAELQELSKQESSQSERAKQLTRELQSLEKAYSDVDQVADGYAATIRAFEGLSSAAATSNTNYMNKMTDAILDSMSTIQVSADDALGLAEERLKIAREDYAKGLITKGQLDAAQRKYDRLYTQAQQAGKQVPAGVAKGIDNGMSPLNASVARMCSQITRQVQEGLKIHSPSRVMADKVGKFLPAGIAQGYEEAMPAAIRRMENSLSGVTKSMQTAIVGRQVQTVTNISTTHNDAGSPNITVHIDPRNVRELNDIIRIFETARQQGRIR